MPLEEFQNLRAGVARIIFSAIGFRIRFPQYVNVAADFGTNGTLTAAGMKTIATPLSKISHNM